MQSQSCSTDCVCVWPVSCADCCAKSPPSLPAAATAAMSTPFCAVSADSSASARHSLQDAVPAATSPATAAAAADAAVGDPVTVAVPSWLSRCSTDSSSSSWGVTLQHLPPQQAIATGAGANQECFSISRQMQCTVSAGSPCCNPSRGPSRLALRIGEASALLLPNRCG
jgi:hypothetical protein